MVTLLKLSNDLLINNLFPLLTLGELLNLCDAYPELEPVVDTFRPWGKVYKERKMMSIERKMSFREYFDKIQSIYLWGFINKVNSMTWLVGRDDMYQRGPVKFHLPQRQGILRSEHGIDLMKPVRMDFNRHFYVERLGHGVFLMANGEVYSRVPGKNINPLPETQNCTPDKFRRSQWATHVTCSDGVTINYIPIDDVLGLERQKFTFPFNNFVFAIVQQRNCLWALIDGKGVVSVPLNYSGGDDYIVLKNDFPEKMICMISLFRNSLMENPDESQAEYNETAVLLGESGRIYFLGMARYCSTQTPGSIMSPMEWRDLYPELNWAGGLEFLELNCSLSPQLQDSLGCKFPKLKTIVPWAYQYGIGVHQDDSTVLYLDTSRIPSEVPFVHNIIVEELGMNGLGEDGRIYRLQLSSGIWHRVPGVEGAIDIFSMENHLHGHLVDSTTTFIRTDSGKLFQLGLIQNAIALQQEFYREVPANYMPSAPRISQQFTGGSINPRHRVFINPFSGLPKQVDLPGKVIDMFHIYKEGMTFAALVKDAHVERSTS